MSRLFTVLFCLTAFLGRSQWVDEGVPFEEDNTWIPRDFVPIQLNGEWFLYDLIAKEPSDSIRITDFVQPSSGFAATFVVKNDSLWGVLNSFGEEEYPFIYDSVIQCKYALFTLQENSWSYHKPLYTDAEGAESEVLVPIVFDSLYDDGTNVYYFNKGKTGIILLNGTIVESKYDGIQRLDARLWRNFRQYLITISGNHYNLLNDSGEELLPEGVWDLRTTEDGVFEFLRGDFPEYYIPYLQTFVKPNGRDVVFYDELGYKIYSDDKTSSQLYLSSGEVLKGTFDDYFILGDGTYKVVRKGNKVGLSKDGKSVIGALKYDQINPITNHWRETKLFRYYHGDSCGLMDGTGRELFSAKYANILETGNNDRFVVLDNKLGGVVNRKGEVIIPVKYDHIFFDESTKLFVVRKNDKIGLFDFNGKQKSPIEYVKYHRIKSFGDEYLVVLGKNDRYYFVQKDQFLSEEGFEHFNFGSDVLKAYGAKSISIFLFDENGKMEERQEYPHYNKAVVRSDNYWNWESLEAWLKSELEENQQEGYFGLRYYKERGFGVQPKYRTIIPSAFSDYLAEVDAFETDTFSLTKEVTTELVKGFHYLETGTGSTKAIEIFGSDLTIMRNGSNDRYLIHLADGTQDQVYPNRYHNEVSISMTHAYNYSDYADRRDFLDLDGDYRRYFSGTRVELCPIDSADLSAWSYFHYWNSISSCRLTPDRMKTLMNPKIGVRFVDKEIEVIDASVFGGLKNVVAYKSPSFFSEFSFLSNDIFFEKPADSIVGTLRTKYIQTSKERIIPVEHVLNATTMDGMYGDYIGAEVQSDQLAKVHKDYPDFFFVYDTVSVSYDAGRIERKMNDNSVKLVTVEGKVIVDESIDIHYLNDDCFAVLKWDGWRLITKDGDVITNELFKEISTFDNGRAQFTKMDGSIVILNPKGEELKPLPEPRVALDSKHYFYRSRSNEIYATSNDLKDQVQDGEKYQGGFFLSKQDGNSIVRPFGSQQTLELKTGSSLKSFGFGMYYFKGKHLYAIDGDLKTSKFKKIEKLQLVTPEIAWLRGKEDVLIDQEWNVIRVLGESERFELRAGELVVYENDSTYQNYGDFKPKEELTATNLPQTKVEVEFRNGYFGAVLGDSVVLPYQYPTLLKINENEFWTKITTEKRLYTTRLERIGNQSFDWYLETESGNFVFFRDDQAFLVTEDRLRCALITVE